MSRLKWRILGTNPFDSTAATTGTDPIPDAATCGQGLGDMLGDIWYSYVPDQSGSLFVSTCSPGSFDTDLVAYTGSCGSLINLDCNGDVNQNTSPTCQQYWSELTLDVTAGENILVPYRGMGNTSSRKWITGARRTDP